MFQEFDLITYDDHSGDVYSIFKFISHLKRNKVRRMKKVGGRKERRKEVIQVELILKYSQKIRNHDILEKKERIYYP